MRIFTNKVILVVAIFTANTVASANGPIELSCVLSYASEHSPNYFEAFPESQTGRPRKIDEKINIVIELSVHDPSLPGPEEQVRVEVHFESVSNPKIEYLGRMTDTAVTGLDSPFEIAGIVYQSMFQIQRKSGDILMFETNDEHGDGEMRASSYKWGVCKKAEDPVF